jgi:hypothetical protein
MCNPGDKYKNSRLFDPYRWSTATEVDAACDELRQLLGLNDRRYKPYVMMALLDLYCSWRSDPTQYVSFSRDKNRYGKYSRYASMLVGHRGIVTLTNRLRVEGFIDYGNAICYRSPVTGIPYAGYTTRMKATKKLIRLIVKHKVKLAMIARHPNEAVIKFRTEKNENDVARDIKDFQAPEDVKRSAKALIRYNDLLQKTYIDLDDELLTHTDLKELKRYDKKLEKFVVEYSIDLSKKRVCRIFNNEDWKQGGRIYCAWWHGCPKELRKYILINGEPVVELDFSAIHVLLLYAHLGKNFLDEGSDAYDEDRGFKRDVIKVVMMSAINAQKDDKADGDTKAIRATWDTLIKKHNAKRKEHGITSHQSLYDMLEEIKEKHPRIKDFLGSGEGIKLMREDSDIAIEIIRQHTKMNVPILSVHDSFIVPRYFEPFTREIMNQAYGKLVARYLGAGYSSETETINCITGEIFKEDTEGNMNVQGLIKPAFKPDVLRNTYMRFDQRTDTKQLWRHRRWKNNKYQYDKVTKFLQERGSSSGGNQ